MRVIAGSARRLLLSTPAGMETRPTADKYKETLFNVLQPYLYADTQFLDLFAGSGAIGIEALSRGVSHAVFVERSKAALQCIRDNLAKTGLSDKADVIAGDVMSALQRMHGKYTFDVIFMDPPYGQDLEKEVLMFLQNSTLIHPDTLIITEVANDTDLSYLHQDGGRFEIVKIKEYKTNSHIFISIRDI
ncbi:MAG: 16S rRNA (guanine(966)-N(2))-methyltransferase RsmD [Lachnospiraceae bacterium]|nr:16S rRNA (guanine(966)-N(2))-methyltransferase RsmD [Lachnospiraceae bacterium]